MSQSVLDLTHDLAASLRERAQLKTRTLTPAQLREKARAEWLEFRNAEGKAADKTKGKKARERMPPRPTVKKKARAAQGMTMISVCEGSSAHARRGRAAGDSLDRR